MQGYQQTVLRHSILKRLRTIRPLIVKGIIAGLAGLLALLISLSSLGQDSDLWILRQLFALRGPIPSPSSVTLVTVDDSTYSELNVSPRLPITRDVIGTFISRVHEARPKAIILDVVFPADESSQAETQILIDAMQGANVVVASGFYEEGPHRDSGGEFKDFGAPIVEVDERMRDVAMLTIPFVLKQSRGKIFQLALSRNIQDLTSAVPLSAVLDPAYREFISTQLTGSELINFYGPPNAFPSLSFSEIVKSGLTPAMAERISDSYVIFGFRSTARNRTSSAKEQFETPVSSFKMFGVEIHSTMLANLLEQSWIRTPSNAWKLRTILMPTIFLVFILSLLPLLQSLLVFVVTSFCLVLLNVYLFTVESYFLPGQLTVFFVTLSSFVVIVVLRYREREGLHTRIQRELGVRLPDL
jgi:CHASE2 domain-containing sensor protein